MHLYTSTNQNWNPFGAIALMCVWLVLVALTAFTIGSGCGGSSPPPSTNGSISLTWSITDQNRDPTTCTQAGARSVALRLRNRANGNVVAAAFPCEGGPGTTQVAAGVYDIAIELHAADGTTLATAPDQTAVGIVANRVKTLTPVTFAANTKGSLVISLATSATTNCQPVGTNGAGITATTITLQIVGDGCAPVTFVRSLGGTQRGTYTVNCTSPLVTTCIEKNETLTTSLAAGAYLIRVRGKIGAVDCWTRDDTLEVPPPGKPLTRMLGLVHQNVPGC
jgi:hypothetical protein